MLRNVSNVVNAALLFSFTLLGDMINEVSVALLTSMRNVNNAADTVLLFNLTSLHDVINAVSVTLLSNLTISM